MVGNHHFHPLKNWLFRIPGEFRVWFLCGLFRQRRLPADSKELSEHTFADAIKQPGEDRIDKDCFVLFVCLFVCLLACFFLLSFPGEPQNQWYTPKSGSGYSHKLILWHLSMHSSVFLPWLQDVINVRVCSYTKLSFVHILLVLIG